MVGGHRPLSLVVIFLGLAPGGQGQYGGIGTAFGGWRQIPLHCRAGVMTWCRVQSPNFFQREQRRIFAAA